MLYPLFAGNVKVISNEGVVGSDPPGTAVASSATTLLDGAVTELISAANNTQESWGIAIRILATGASAVASEACLDILIGGATDDVLIPALICGYSSANAGAQYFFPLHIPSGLRLAASLASVRTSITSQVIVSLYGGTPPPFPVGRKVTTYGTQANNARGQSITPATSGGAATATEITASTTRNHIAFMVGFQPETDASTSQLGYNVGIGVGAATEERIGTWQFITNTSESVFPQSFPMPAFRDVPSGTRLSILASNSGTNDAAYGGLIYAVD